jgi:SSS family solute:Na+ symporter
MEDWVIILLVLALYLGVVMAIGVLSARGRKQTVDEYVNAGRDLGFFITYFLLGAAIFSAFAFLGGPGWAYSKGAAAFFILGYCATGLWLFWIFGGKVMRLGRLYGYSTQAELLSDRFQSRWLSIIVAVVSILAFIQYITLQMKGCGHVVRTLTGGKISFEVGALVAYAVVVAYVFFGGLRGVAWTNVFQGGFMIGLAWFVGLYIPNKLYGGFEPMFRQIAEAKPGFLLVGKEGSMITHLEFSSSLIVSFLGFTMWPQLFMRLYNIRSERVLKKIIAGYPVFAILMVPVLMVGFAGVHYVDLTAEGLLPDDILPYMIQHIGFPAVIVGLFGAGTLAASMSTQDTVTHAAATIFGKDLYARFLNRELSEREMMGCIRIAVVVFGAVAYLTAIYGGTSLVQLLLGAYGSIVQLLPLVLFGLYWPRATGCGAIAGILSGVTVNYLISLKVIPAEYMLGIHAGIWGLAVNLIFFVSFSLLDNPQEKAHLARFAD